MKVKVFALILAGGRGERFGAPKQVVEVGSKTLLQYSLEAFQSHAGVDEVVLVIHRDLRKEVLPYMEAYPKLRKIVEGGKTRQESSRRGLFSLEEDGFVLVHDAARPNLKPELIDRVIAGLGRAPAVVPVVPVGETLARLEGEVVRDFPPRKDFFRVQTPQGFRVSLIKEAHERVSEAGFTDDASLFLSAGMGPVLAVEGDPSNIKITYPGDLKFLEGT